MKLATKLLRELHGKELRPDEETYVLYAEGGHIKISTEEDEKCLKFEVVYDDATFAYHTDKTIEELVDVIGFLKDIESKEDDES